MTRLLIIRNVHADFITVTDRLNSIQDQLLQQGFALASSYEEVDIYDNNDNEENGRHTLVFISTGDRVINVTLTTT